MNFENLTNAKTVIAFIPLIERDVKCKIEEFERMKMVDGEPQCIGKSYKIIGKIDELEVEFHVENQEECDIYKLRRTKNK